MLLACGASDPVDEDAVAPPDRLAGDEAASGLAAPGNSSAAELARKAALPPASGFTWAYRAPDRIAEFGPTGSPAFSIQCQVQREGPRQLVFIRYLPPGAGAQGTLSFTGNGRAASVPIAAVVNPDGIGGHWRAAVAPGDSVRDVAQAFAGPGAVEVSIGGHPPLVVPANAAPRRVLADCLAG